MYYGEMIFSDMLKDYYTNFKRIQQNIMDIDSSITNNLIVSKQNEISIKINSSLSSDINKIMEVVNMIDTNLKKYIENLNVLNNGFINGNLNLDIDIPFFKEAVDIIENEL